MSKLLYITEEQLQEIIGNGAYLNDKDTSNEYRLGGAEISVDGVTGDYIDGTVETGDVTTTDDISKSLRSKGRRLSCDVFRNGNLLPESNQDLSGKTKTIQLSQNSLNTLKKNVEHQLKNNQDEDEEGIKRAKYLIRNNGVMPCQNAYRAESDSDEGIIGDVFTDDIMKDISNKLKTKEQISSNNRESKKRRGERVIKSSPKDGTKGGAHSPNNNTIGYTYF
jgi:hypothetical protein